MQLNNLFRDYAQELNEVRTQIAQGDVSKAISISQSPTKGTTNYQLSLLEQGRLAFLNQDYKQSQWWFNQSYQALESDREKANLRVGRGLEKVNALITNDNAIGYQPAAYEQSMMHGYQALNYLFQNNLEAALVEVRRANIVQETALNSYEQELLEAKSNTNGVNWQEVNDAIAPLDSRIGEVKNGFQNAYTFYLSGLLYEAANQLNDAYIDYKKALEIYPDNSFLQKDVLRLGSVLGMDNDLNVFKQRFNHEVKTKSVNNGELVVIYEQGLIDAMQEHSLRLPVWTSNGDMRFYSFSVPTYGYSNFVENPLIMEVEGKVLQTEAIVKLQSLVAKQLKDNMPAIVARQALRIISKEQLRRKMSKEGGDVGNILAGLYSLASENADTRSWLTLPGDVQMLRTQHLAGKQQLKFSGMAPLEVEINAKRITLVFISQIGGYQTVKVAQL
ncbi:hypothetical protein HII17_17770 [Thalassotalea sp. M1531]|uniref:Tetratricopeptide repeat protein n=1 Tax=Thalassotalea algicola TaxID=2716224 RepID=A0A7Y0LF73_9GAMM|nr:hypothetical protein [Thalassotalea algicola]NMP33399.1 hypothetical protein [Thalassotalea algicola]